MDRDASKLNRLSDLTGDLPTSASLWRLARVLADIAAENQSYSEEERTVGEDVAETRDIGHNQEQPLIDISSQ